MRMRFSDGMTIDTGGPLRVLAQWDGWYVAGEGMLLPMDSCEEGEAFISDYYARQNGGAPCDK